MVVAGSYGVSPTIDVSLGAILGGASGLYASSIFFLRDGAWRPAIVVGLPVLLVKSAQTGTRTVQPGGRLAVGIEWTPRSWLSFVAQLGIEYFPRADKRHVTTLYAPSFGIRIRR
jgi:hypothetical protein